MQQPEVTAIALYADRSRFMPRLLRCFRSQTYQEKWLLIYDSGRVPLDIPLGPREILVRDEPRGLAIGALRNAANSLARTPILIHMDVDDWSSRSRFSEQVEMLQVSEAAAVGANEMLMWRAPYIALTPVDATARIPLKREGEAWLYTHGMKNYLIGTSLCYWRKTWEAKPFPDRNTGEDTEWQKGLVTAGCTSIAPVGAPFGQPCLIAEIHGANTCLTVEPRSDQWKRVPEWDERLRKITQL